MEGTTFGFVGVGRMGGPMTMRLLNAGHRVVVFDTSDAAVEPLVKSGAVRAQSAAEVANAAKIVFLSLPNPEIVQNVALGKDGVIDGTAVKRVVDFSTIGPRTAGIVAEGARRQGHRLRRCAGERRRGRCARRARSRSWSPARRRCSRNWSRC